MSLRPISYLEGGVSNHIDVQYRHKLPMAERISAGGYASGLLKQYCGVHPTDNSFFSLCGTTSINVLRSAWGEAGVLCSFCRLNHQDRGMSIIILPM
jgi:hypothetical protein